MSLWEKQPSIQNGQPSFLERYYLGPGWVVFAALAVLGLFDTVVMLASNGMGYSIGLGWNKEIHAVFKGMALAASPSSPAQIVFTLASLAAQLGVILLITLFAYLAYRGSTRGYATGIAMYASGLWPVLVEGDFATAVVHFVFLAGLLIGLVKLKTMSGQLADSEGSMRPKRLRPVTIGASLGCGGLAIATVMLAILGFSLSSTDFLSNVEQRILERAPGDMTAAEREQFHSAMVELAELERLGHINLARDHALRQALSVAVAGEKMGREEILTIVRLVAEASEQAGRSLGSETGG